MRKRKSFRPHIGDYFFIIIINSVIDAICKSVSVPILGIIFLSEHKEQVIRLLEYELFPSPYWGLFFYRTKSL